MPRHCKKSWLRRRPVGPPPLEVEVEVEVEVIAVTRNNSIIINLALYIYVAGTCLLEFGWLLLFL